MTTLTTLRKHLYKSDHASHLLSSGRESVFWDPDDGCQPCDGVHKRPSHFPEWGAHVYNEEWFTTLLFYFLNQLMESYNVNSGKIRVC